MGLRNGSRALQEPSERPQERSGSPRNGPRAFRKSWERLQERSGSFRNGLKSVPGALGAAPRVLREPSERPQERSGSPWNAPRALREPSERPEERFRSPRDGCKSAPTGFETASRLEMAALGAVGLLRSGIFEQRSEYGRKSSSKKAVRVHLTRIDKLRANHLRA